MFNMNRYRSINFIKVNFVQIQSYKGIYSRFFSFALMPLQKKERKRFQAQHRVNANVHKAFPLVNLELIQITIFR